MLNLLYLFKTTALPDEYNKDLFHSRKASLNKARLATEATVFVYQGDPNVASPPPFCFPNIQLAILGHL